MNRQRYIFNETDGFYIGPFKDVADAHDYAHEAPAKEILQDKKFNYWSFCPDGVELFSPDEFREIAPMAIKVVEKLEEYDGKVFEAFANFIEEVTRDIDNSPTTMTYNFSPDDSSVWQGIADAIDGNVFPEPTVKPKNDSPWYLECNGFKFDPSIVAEIGPYPSAGHATLDAIIFDRYFSYVKPVQDPLEDVDILSTGEAYDMLLPFLANVYINTDDEAVAVGPFPTKKEAEFFQDTWQVSGEIVKAKKAFAERYTPGDFIDSFL